MIESFKPTFHVACCMPKELVYLQALLDKLLSHSMVIQIMRLVDAKPLCKAYMDRFSINDPNKE
jgi:hypothetical protein